MKKRFVMIIAAVIAAMCCLSFGLLGCGGDINNEPEWSEGEGHRHVYGAWESSDNVSHVRKCHCGEEESAPHDFVGKVCAVCGVGANESVGLTYRTNDDSSGFIVTGLGECADKDILIPETYKSLPVKEIGAGAFSYKTGLRAVYISGGVTKIGDEAFSGCSSLTVLSVGKNVAEIASNAFDGCPIETAALPASAAGGIPTSKLISVSITAGESIEDRAFQGCKELAKLTICGSVKSIGLYAFSGCDKLSDICYTGDIAGWCGIDGLRYVMYGENYRQLYIGNKLIEGELIIPNGVTGIAGHAFLCCSGITSVTVPGSVTSIGEGAFGRNPKLVEVYNLSGLEIKAGDTSNGNIGYFAKDIYTSKDSPSKLSVTGDGYTVYDDGNNGCYLVNYTGNRAVLNLPEKINGKNYKINDYAFFCCAWLSSVTIPNGIADIPQGAFSACFELESVTLSNGVTGIGDAAFGGCFKLASVALPNGVTAIGKNAFYGCGQLTSISIPDSVTSIGSDAFEDCSGLTSVTIPSGVTSISNGVFRRCSGLTSVVIPNGVTSIGNYAFSGCRGLTSVVIPNSVTSIGSDAFQDCNGLTSVTIPSGVTSIGSGVFFGCSGLTSVVIPNGVTSIGNYAFSGCSGLTSVVIPNSVTSIGSDAFFGCSGLTSVVIPNSVTSIGSDAFENCSGLTSVTIPSGVTSIGSGVFRRCSGLVSVTIPNGVTSIGNYAFSGCSGLVSITIPDGVIDIGSSAFSDCYRLVEVYNLSKLNIQKGDHGFGNLGYYAKDIYTSKSSPSKLSITLDGYILYDGGKNNCFLVGYTGSAKVLRLPNDINGKSYEINGRAFYDCDELTSVVMPGGVTAIGDNAFYDCSSLTSVTIGSGVTRIGYFTFQACYKLVEVYNLSKLNITKGSTLFGYVGYYAKDVYTSTGAAGKLTTTYDGYTFYIGSDICYLLEYSGSRTDLTLPENINGKNYAIYQYAFYKNDNITSITIPDSVTGIEHYTFYRCDKLTSVTMGSGVTHIGDYAFYYCDKLTSVTIDSGVTHIGDYAFRACSRLDSITFRGTKAQWDAIEKGRDWGSDIWAIIPCIARTEM